MFWSYCALLALLVRLSPFGHLGHLVLEGISFFMLVKIVLLFLFWFLSAPYKTSMADFSKNFQNFKPQLWACNWLLSEINRAKKSHSDLIKLPWKYGFTVKLTLLFYPGGKIRTSQTGHFSYLQNFSTCFLFTTLIISNLLSMCFKLTNVLNFPSFSATNSSANLIFTQIGFILENSDENWSSKRLALWYFTRLFLEKTTSASFFKYKNKCKNIRRKSLQTLL